MKLFALTTLALVTVLVQHASSAPATDVVKASAVAKEEEPTTSTTTIAPTPTPTYALDTHTHPPHTHTHVHTDDCKKEGVAPGTGEYYDQRQNGTHNIRVEIDNIVILHAPLDMGSASTEGDEEIAAFLTQLTQLAESEAANNNKDKPPTTTAGVEAGEEKPDKDKPAAAGSQKKTRTKVRLANLLGPLLRHHV